MDVKLDQGDVSVPLTSASTVRHALLSRVWPAGWCDPIMSCKETSLFGKIASPDALAVSTLGQFC
jgi:hypothetical protein